MLIQKDSNVIFWVKIIPNSQKNEIIGWKNSHLKIRIKAPPEKNKANLELISFLSQVFDVPKHTIEITIGKTSPTKYICIKNTTVLALSKKLEKALPL